MMVTVAVDDEPGATDAGDSVGAGEKLNPGADAEIVTIAAAEVLARLFASPP